MLQTVQVRLISSVSMKRAATAKAANQITKRWRPDVPASSSTKPVPHGTAGRTDLGLDAFVNFAPKAFTSSVAVSLFQQVQVSCCAVLCCAVLCRLGHATGTQVVMCRYFANRVRQIDRSARDRC